MLQAIREKAQGWIAWGIIILISIPFALWGIQEYLGVGSEPEVAKVNGDGITQRLLDQRTRDFRENMRYQLGDGYRPQMFEDTLLKPQVLEAMIEEKVLADAAADWNLRTSDAQARGFIASVPGFQRDGRFDAQIYEAAVRNRGMSRAGFEQTVRQDLAVSQLRAGVRDSAFVTDSQLADWVRLGDEKRAIRYVRIPASGYLDQVDANNDAVRAFYDANKDRYRTPERVKLGYLLLDSAVLAPLVDVNDDALRGYFADHRAELLGREERAVRHILVAASPGADSVALATAAAKAQDLLEQLRGGADFAELARANSEDPGSAASGGDLGWVERGVMVAPFEEAAFALDEGALSDVVQTDFGFHILQVTDIRGGSDATFEDVRADVERAYRAFEAENLYYDYAERLAEAAYENPASLTPAAEALGLEVRISDWLMRDGSLPAPLDSPRVANAAYAEDVLVEGHNSELMELGPQRSVVVRVTEHEPAGVVAFEGNEQQVTEDYRAHQARVLAEAAGRGEIDALRAGSQALTDVAARHDWQLTDVGAVARTAQELPGEVLTRVFELAPDNAAAQFAGVTADNGDYLLIEVSETQRGSLEALAVAERPLLAEQLATRVADQQVRYLTENLRARADIEKQAISE